jgi:hypothetical protein
MGKLIIAAGARGQWRYTAALAVAMLAFVGCSDDDDRATSQASTTEAETAPATETSEDQRIADEAQLTLEDFPTGWQENDENAQEPEQSPCDAVKEARGSTTARGASPDFSEGNNTEAGSFAYIYADEPDAAQAFDALASDETRECLGQSIADELADQAAERGVTGSDLEVGDASTSRVSIDPLGDDREAIRVQVPISSEGVDADYYIDAAYIRVGRGIALLTTIDLLSPFDEELRADLLSKVVRRLSTSLEE